MKTKKILNSLLFLLVLFLPAVSAQEITVAAAANVQYALEELKTEFEKNTDIKLKTIIGSSGTLTAQIENGAPFDIFISADMEYPEILHKEGLTYQPPKIYAYGGLVLWTLKDLDLSKGLKIIADPSVKKIALANPKTAPYGRQAINAMKLFQLYKDVESKLVYGESIAQVNQFITAQAVDVGFTAKSVVLAPNLLTFAQPINNILESKGRDTDYHNWYLIKQKSVKEKGTWVELDPNSYSPIAQGVVILKHAEGNNLKEAQAFYDFLFSPQAGEIFKKYGYVLP